MPKINAGRDSASNTPATSASPLDCHPHLQGKPATVHQQTSQLQKLDSAFDRDATREIQYVKNDLASNKEQDFDDSASEKEALSEGTKALLKQLPRMPAAPQDQPKAASKAPQTAAPPLPEPAVYEESSWEPSVLPAELQDQLTNHAGKLSGSCISMGCQWSSLTYQEDTPLQHVLLACIIRICMFSCSDVACRGVSACSWLHISLTQQAEHRASRQTEAACWCREGGGSACCCAECCS